MQLQVTQTAIIKCSITGNQYEIDPHTIDIQLEYKNNRAMGPENGYDCVVYHEELGEISWTVWEYPQGVINLIDSNLNDHTELVPPKFEFVEENVLPIYISGQAIIQSATSANRYTIDTSQITIEFAFSDTIVRNGEIVYLCTVNHSQLGTLYWEIWSEQTNKDNYIQHYLNNHRLIYDFEFKVTNTDIEVPFISNDKTKPLVDWFLENYENPREGGWQWYGRGPHDAYDVISNHFDNIPQIVAEIAAGEVEDSEGGLTEWAEKIKDEDFYIPNNTENESLFISDDELKTIMEFNDIVENIPTTVQFNITPDDKIDISEKLVDYNNHSLSLFATLQETTQTVFNVCAGLNNTHPELFQCIENYYNTVQLKNETPSLYKIISSGDFLINYLEITKKHENDETSMGLDKEVNLNTLITAHYDFIKSTKEGKEVLANRNNNDKDSITPIVYNIINSPNTNILSNNSQQFIKEIPNQSPSVGQHILRHISTELIKYSISCIFKYIAISTNTLDFIPHILHILPLLERIMPYIDTLDFKYKNLLFKVYDIIKKFKK